MRLGLIGDEFKTARGHLLDHLEGCIAWKDPAQAAAQKERLRKKREEELVQSRQEENPPDMELQQEQTDGETPVFSISMTM